MAPDRNPGNNSNDINNMSFLIPFLAYGILFFTFVGAVIELALGSSLSLLSLVSPVIFLIIYSGNRIFVQKQPVIPVITALILVIISFGTVPYISGAFFDLSWDGQVYHQEAVIQLAHGWNPWINNTAPDWLPTRLMVEQINHFPYSTEILSALIYQIFGEIEYAKALILMLLLPAGMLLFNVLRHSFKLTFASSLIITLTTLLNPVVIVQSLNFYLDGTLYLLFISCAVATVLFFKKPGPGTFVLLLSVSSILFNIKFTGIPYVGVLFTSAVLVKLLQRKNSGWKQATGLTSSLLAISVTGILVLGYHPYVTNTIEKGHPFYPAMGENKHDLFSKQRPGGYAEKNRLEKLGASLFSPSTSQMGGEELAPKLPFSINWPQERDPFYEPDVRVAGFGPLFSGALVVSLLLGILIFLLGIERKAAVLGLLLPLAIISVTVIIHPESWWARFVPQLFLLPVLVAAYALSIKQGITTSTVLLLVAVLLINSGIVASAYYPYNLKMKQEVEEQLRFFTRLPDYTRYYFDDFRSNRIRLQEHGIKFTEMRRETFACQQKYYLVYSAGYACHGLKRK